MQFTTAIVAALAGLASAQSVQVVTVSSKNGSLTYSPNSVKAAAGSMVQFQFIAGNHTVTQSTFDQPCQPINTVMSNVTGFHSGFMPVSASAKSGMVPTYTVMVNNTTPIWVYCAQAKHCESGMVMVINENTTANKSRSLANFKSLASKATTVIPSGSSSGTTGTGTTSSGTGTSTGSGTSSGTAGASSSAAVTTSGGEMVKAGASLGLSAVAAAAALMLL